ncbi:hypothetical protein ANOM_005168 [Aspergillus nomiae NRRL 13137]|uniref:Uncharacterized protein n=1 Tax=Aspergillus nomiae NRRL (strain ATCC 15546 / NRRL 13137 / CBS 260.88 / M93) TaxID=1509407 RepID=A0A0L1J1E1_ASPN3|nr:uncharacterized protein ANOM_005168 [Aspergillus nomiae NRRL 13137]KNG85465.1 hypothetical protein ANOM_005168 [Aspergillus nomiae NRRL 13137]
MADVRSLLRNELASRKGSNQTGRAATTTTNRVTKKRKVDPEDDLTRKKMRHAIANADPKSANIRTVQPPSAQSLDEDIELSEQDTAGPEPPSDEDAEQISAQPSAQPSEAAAASNNTTEQAKTIDEDEWAAFEREVAAPTRAPQAPAAVAAQATISAAPVSAEQLAAQQEKENDTIARGREAEAEGEREDAARFLEDEFDEMEQLEERVRRLKHKREELRNMRATGVQDVGLMDGPASGATVSGHEKGQEDEENDDDDDDDDDDDWDNWRFR